MGEIRFQPRPKPPPEDPLGGYEYHCGGCITSFFNETGHQEIQRNKDRYFGSCRKKRRPREVLSVAPDLKPWIRTTKRGPKRDQKILWSPGIPAWLAWCPTVVEEIENLDASRAGGLGITQQELEDWHKLHGEHVQP